MWRISIDGRKSTGVKENRGGNMKERGFRQIAIMGDGNIRKEPRPPKVVHPCCYLHPILQTFKQLDNLHTYARMRSEQFFESITFALRGEEPGSPWLRIEF
jgi:hypothetical protein